MRPRQPRWCLGGERNLLILKMKCRFAIRAAKFGPETDAVFVLRGNKEFHETDEMRGSFEGAIRIPLRALSFLFSDLAFLCIPCKSLKFLPSLFSISTTPGGRSGNRTEIGNVASHSSH